MFQIAQRLILLIVTTKITSRLKYQILAKLNCLTLIKMFSHFNYSFTITMRINIKCNKFVGIRMQFLNYQL